MAKEEPAQCTVCGVTLTVKHIITVLSIFRRFKKIQHSTSGGSSGEANDAEPHLTIVQKKEVYIL
jgi:hypothetical protein